MIKSTQYLVRLPLTDEQERAIVVAQTGTPPSVKADTEAAIRAIGTRVEAGDLATVGYVAPGDIFQNGAMWPMRNIYQRRADAWPDAVVRRTDAEAQIASRDKLIAEQGKEVVRTGTQLAAYRAASTAFLERIADLQAEIERLDCREAGITIGRHQAQSVISAAIAVARSERCVAAELTGGDPIAFDPWPEMDALLAALDTARPGWRECVPVGQDNG
ncbi:hypothetical protein HLH33_13115 [Gluconacetobacter diazotrophicus]|uniref:Uncharacterized protein n=1 Tax=Gluconacetobacter diazotrophicus TaxID=33996 RepID=A0A7W4I6M2_GLUDI|nr:hypothetical protein [Gluconacetobacter diazotrophicus]MBB2157240.1 hypothetical protein [Gluconacetobacter diazotrophicus]